MTWAWRFHAPTCRQTLLITNNAFVLTWKPPEFPAASLNLPASMALLESLHCLPVIPFGLSSSASITDESPTIPSSIIFQERVFTSLQSLLPHSDLAVFNYIWHRQLNNFIPSQHHASIFYALHKKSAKSWFPNFWGRSCQVCHQKLRASNARKIRQILFQAVLLRVAETGRENDMDMRWVFRKWIWHNRQTKGFTLPYRNRKDSNGFSSRPCIISVCLFSTDKVPIVNRNSIAVFAWDKSKA